VQSRRRKSRAAGEELAKSNIQRPYLKLREAAVGQTYFEIEGISKAYGDAK